MSQSKPHRFKEKRGDTFIFSGDVHLKMSLSGGMVGFKYLHNITVFRDLHVIAADAHFKDVQMAVSLLQTLMSEGVV